MRQAKKPVAIKAVIATKGITNNGSKKSNNKDIDTVATPKPVSSKASPDKIKIIIIKKMSVNLL